MREMNKLHLFYDDTGDGFNTATCFVLSRTFLIATDGVSYIKDHLFFKPGSDTLNYIEKLTL